MSPSFDDKRPLMIWLHRPEHACHYLYIVNIRFKTNDAKLHEKLYAGFQYLPIVVMVGDV